jgi:long-chain acyl-CoA synthetase
MNRPWLARYETGVPHAVDHRPLLLHQLLSAAARRFPDRTALVFSVGAAGRIFDTSMTWARLAESVEAVAASLRRRGVKKGDRVALYLPNCPQFVITFLAVARLGGIAVPFNPLYSAREAEHQLKDCGARVAVVLDLFYPLVDGVRDRTALETIVVTRLKEHFPPALWLLYTLTKERSQPRRALRGGDVRFRDLLVPGEAGPPPDDEEETAVLLYTGGTTGISKGVELSHRNLIVNAEQNRAWAGLGEGTETTLAALPLFHAFGLTCCLAVGLLTGSTMVLVPNPTDTLGLILTIARHRPTVFPVVPTLLISITNHPATAGRDLRSIRVMPCAGSALPPSVQRAFRDKTGVHPVEGYGLTEAAPVVMGNPPFGEDRPGTVGLPYPGTDARIVDIETGLLDMPFEGDWTRPGEIVVKGPQVMKGYWNRPPEAEGQFRDGWLRTGDIGQMHRDGYFRIVDRLKDMIIRSGMKIYPAEVEAILHEHPKVLEALVIGVPDRERGELVRAYVVPRPGVTVREEEILAYCRENLARYKVPASIEFRESLRRSAIGKPLRRALREELSLVTV